MLTPVRHVGLVGRRAADAHLAERRHHLQDVEVPDDLHQLRRRAARDEAHDLGAGHVDVDEHPGDRLRGRGHRLRGHGEVQGVVCDKEVQEVHLGPGDAVHLDDDAVADGEGGAGVEGGIRDDEPHLGPLVDHGVLLDGALGEGLEALGSGHGILLAAAEDGRSGARDAERRSPRRLRPGV